MAETQDGKKRVFVQLYYLLQVDRRGWNMLCQCCGTEAVTTVSAGHREVPLCLGCLRVIGDDAAARREKRPRVSALEAWDAALASALAVWERAPRGGVRSTSAYERQAELGYSAD